MGIRHAGLISRYMFEAIPGVDNPANFFAKVLSPTEFKRESEHLMSTVEIPENMKDIIAPSAEESTRSKRKIHLGGMEIPPPAAAHELQGILSQLNPDEVNIQEEDINIEQTGLELGPRSGVGRGRHRDAGQ